MMRVLGTGLREPLDDSESVERSEREEDDGK
jgi:hypothetical protein